VKDLERLQRLPAGARIFLGLDLSKTGWHVTVRHAGETLTDFAAPPRPAVLEPLLNAARHCKVRSVYEAGPFGYHLHDWLVARDVDSVVCCPALVPVQAGNRVKTDRRDALKLATLLEAGLLQSIAVPSPQQRADRELVRERERIVRRRRAVMVQIRAFFLSYGIEPPIQSVGGWTKIFVAWLDGLTLDDPLLQATLTSLRRGYHDADRHLAEHTKLLRQLARDDRHAALVTLLNSVPGFGWLTSLTFAVEIFDWARFESGEAFSAYLGLTPSQYSSGERVRMGRITRVGNRRLRCLLVEACWNALRVDPGLRKTYDDIKRRRGGKRAIVAVARRMCHRLLAMTRTGELYRLKEAA
jgi:transposase